MADENGSCPTASFGSGVNWTAMHAILPGSLTDQAALNKPVHRDGQQDTFQSLPSCLKLCEKAETPLATTSHTLQSMTMPNHLVHEANELLRELQAVFRRLEGALRRLRSYVIAVFIPFFLFLVLAVHTVPERGGADSALRLHLFASLTELLLLLILAFYGSLTLGAGFGNGRAGAAQFRSPTAQRTLSLLVLLLCALLSTSSPGQRTTILGLRTASVDAADEKPATRHNGDAAALWIAVAHTFIAVFGLLSVETFIVVSQICCVQHISLQLIFPSRQAAESGGGSAWDALGFSPVLRSGVQLSFLAGLLAVAVWRFDSEIRLRQAAARLSQPGVFTAATKHADPMQEASSTQSLSAAFMGKQNLALSEMLTELVAARAVLLDLAAVVPTSHCSLAWLGAVSHVLQIIDRASVKFQVEQRNGNNHWNSRAKTNTQDRLKRIVKQATIGFLDHVLDEGHESESAENDPTDVESFLVQSFMMKPEPAFWGRQRSLKDRMEPMDSIKTAPEVVTPHLPEAAAKTLGKWSFDALAVEEAAGQTLQRVGYELLSAFSVLPRGVLIEFLDALEEGYHKENEYHMQVHAADVCNAAVFLTTSIGLWHSTHMTDGSKLSLLLAALGHDLGHFGRNNHFIVSTGHGLAIRYNDKSVLENFHCASLFELLSDCHERAQLATIRSDLVLDAPISDIKSRKQKSGQLLDGLRADVRQKMRHLIIMLILATDTQFTLETLNEFSMQLDILESTLLHGGIKHDENDISFDPLQSAKDQNQTLCFVMRSSDIGHSAKPWVLHEGWSRRITAEFHSQGDEEQSLGIPCSPLCDRTNFVLSSSQIGFLQFVCIPTWTQMGRLEAALHTLHSAGLTLFEEQSASLEPETFFLRNGNAIQLSVIKQVEDNLRAWQVELEALKKGSPHSRQKPGVSPRNAGAAGSRHKLPTLSLAESNSSGAACLPGTCCIETNTPDGARRID
eukprot:TRINITY_DN21535_c0_g1_i1.p1 TRINITY_DN21535_c0_g1~~TRINITY_DN21535_c0_g1_i1.p1  ORF type:complete len:963 (+),score=193.93 TRINITY_DN21535_c0_g1_i1:64-2952(+)